MVNYIGILQERLQAWAPGLGARPEELYFIEEERIPQAPTGFLFNTRVVLINTTDADGKRRMPWSRGHSKIKPARQSAAEGALVELHATGARPHDPSQMAVAVGLQHRSMGLHASTATLSVAMEAVLPPLDDLVGVKAIVSFARQAGVLITPNSGANTLGMFDLTFEMPKESGVGVGASARRDGASRQVQDQQIPPNLGQLGEEYAAAWVQQQPWSAPGSVKWLNSDADVQDDHDLECEPIAAPGEIYFSLFFFVCISLTDDLLVGTFEQNISASTLTAPIFSIEFRDSGYHRVLEFVCRPSQY
jgi:hypothetical protein